MVLWLTFCELVSKQRIRLQSTQNRVHHFFHEFGSRFIFDV